MPAACVLLTNADSLLDRTDTACLCASTAFHDSVASCLESSCTADDITAVLAFEATECGTCTSLGRSCSSTVDEGTDVRWFVACSGLNAHAFFGGDRQPLLRYEGKTYTCFLEREAGWSTQSKVSTKLYHGVVLHLVVLLFYCTISRVLEVPKKSRR